MRKIISGLGIISGIVCAAGASAESVTLTGDFPAAYREASFLTRMAIDRFDGGDGPALSIALERALSGNGGAAHFAVVSMARRSGMGPVDADGVLSGVVSTEVNENRDVQKREECAEKVDNKCTKKQQVEIICRKRTIDVIADLRIVRARDRSVAYSSRKSRHDEVTWCPNASAPGAVEGTIRGMIDSVAAETAREIAPYTERYVLRFYENRTGMPKGISNEFKAAIRLTQQNLPEACRAFAAIDTALPGQVSVTYDLGICAEARGDYAEGMALYQRAAAIRPRDRADFDAGIDRIQRLIVARNDERERQRRR
ncbi:MULTISPECIES: tetratricopeptide repeat protein [unclassified Sphingomonas]|uniref:tetratricopeptide repeat protein n=1 Tax=unclassified Sphingomonas TaxID=196159 RepID=UPI000BCB6C4A|nr:MAG: hypothetical protein B7Z43_03870 [Sphingomonas sp. 12-62-6]OYX38856.1 MAG: hypothetical protein B7Y98_06970 [Sphingomonas sp. 32-62-10]